jgi:two-component system CheB/CheR fusion protein
MTFVDIDRLRRASDTMTQAQADSRAIIDALPQSVVVLDGKLRVVSANRAFYELFQTNAKRVVGEPLVHLDGWGEAGVEPRLLQILQGGPGFAGQPVQAKFARAGRKSLRLGAHRMSGESAESVLILLTVDDMTL